MNLTEEEATALAKRLIARRVSSPNWLEWEDVPALGEYAFERLDEAVNREAQELSRKADAADVAKDIDSLDLLEQAQS